MERFCIIKLWEELLGVFINPFYSEDHNLMSGETSDVLNQVTMCYCCYCEINMEYVEEYSSSLASHVIVGVVRPGRSI